MGFVAKQDSLMNDVRKFVTNKMKYIKSVDEIPVTSRITESGLEAENLDLYDELYSYKKLLQHLINLYTNPTLYRGMLVKFNINEEKYVTSFENEKDLEESQVEEALYNYIYCLSTIQKKESYSDMDGNDFNSFKCLYCNHDIGQEEEELCRGCDESIIEMRMKLKTRKKEQDMIMNYKDEKLIDDSKSENKIFVTSKIDISSDKNMSIKEGERGKNIDKNEFNVHSEDKENQGTIGGIKINKYLHKWKCRTCECLSGYEFIECVACGGRYEDGKWMCKGCMEERSCNIGVCDKCGNNNENVKIKENEIERSNSSLYYTVRGMFGFENQYDKRKEIEIKLGNDEWECGKCGLFQSFDFINCKLCYGRRSKHGSWRCHKCTMKNKCINIKCETCGECNQYLCKIYCINCKKNEVIKCGERCKDCFQKYGRGFWICPFDHCKNWNERNYDFCEKCKIWRHSPRDRGDTIKIMSNKGEESVWICEKCHTLNNLKNNECICGKKRYKKGLVKKFWEKTSDFLSSLSSKDDENDKT